MPKIFNESNPSYSLDEAIYQFGIFYKGKFTKLIFVHAENWNQVATIETIRSLTDEKISENCCTISVMRSVTTKCVLFGDNVAQVPFVDFIMEFVDGEIFSRSNELIEYFKGSLSEEDKEYMEEKLQKLQGNPESSSILNEVHEEKPNEDPTDTASRIEKIRSSLVGLGFDKGSVERWIKSQGAGISLGTIEQKCKEAIRSIASVN